MHNHKEHQIHNLSTQNASSTVCHSFIHSDHFYNVSSSQLLLRSAPDTARILCQSFTPKRHRQLRVKNFPKVPIRGAWSGIRTHDHSDERRRIYQCATTPPPGCLYFYCTTVVSVSWSFTFTGPNLFVANPKHSFLHIHAAIDPCKHRPINNIQ